MVSNSCAQGSLRAQIRSLMRSPLSHQQARARSFSPLTKTQDPLRLILTTNVCSCGRVRPWSSRWTVTWRMTVPSSFCTLHCFDLLCRVSLYPPAMSQSLPESPCVKPLDSPMRRRTCPSELLFQSHSEIHSTRHCLKRRRKGTWTCPLLQSHLPQRRNPLRRRGPR